MKEEGKKYVDVSRVSIVKINKNIAKDMIVKHHYSHSWTSCRYALGIYYKEENDYTFGDHQLIGCLIYGHPVGRTAAASICEGFGNDNALELTRLYIHDGYGSNIESYALSLSFKWIKENDKDIKLLLSYADSGQMHLGGIYQATNWIYQGLSGDIALMPNYGISLRKDPYKWIHSRTVGSRWGSRNLEHLKTEIGKEGHAEFWRMKEPDKHRYIQILSQNKQQKRELFGKLKHESKPYPKNAEEYIPEIEHHLTYDPVDKGVNFW